MAEVPFVEEPGVTLSTGLDRSMTATLAFLVASCLFTAARAQQEEFDTVQIPSAIENDPAASALLPHVVGLQTAERCYEQREGISQAQLESLRLMVNDYAEALGVSKQAEDAVRIFAATIVLKGMQAIDPADWKARWCAEVRGIFSEPSTARPDRAF